MINRKRMLEDEAVIEEINRHKWLKSEVQGEDIGFDKAADDWFEKHGEHWVRHHLKS